MFRSAVHCQNPNEHFMSMKNLLPCIRPTYIQASEVKYIEVLDAVADKKSSILDNLYEIHIVNNKLEYVIGKEMLILETLKFKHGKEYYWLILYWGDWNLLKITKYLYWRCILMQVTKH